MIHKAMIMNVFGFSLNQTEDLSIEELKKWKAAADWIKLEIDLAPFKKTKNYTGS